MKEIVRYVASKSTRTEDCEDELIVTDNFACVADGATSQSKRDWSGRTGGQLAAHLVCSSVARMRADASATEAMDAATLALAECYRQEGIYAELQRQPWDRAAASCVIYSAERKEIWMVGDCQCLLMLSGGQTERITNSKAVDRVNAEARSLFIQAELLRGKTVSELQANDPGRRFIEPLLRIQRMFQNPPMSSPKVNSEFAYWVIDGFDIPPKGIRIVEIGPDVKSLILASDGYPKLFPSLEQTEAFLQQLIHDDPLLVRGAYKSTKGVSPGNASFDDRSFLQIDANA